jgi:hypothetical protein
MTYKLIFGEDSKINNSEHFVKSSFFIDSIYSNERRKTTNDFKKLLEKTEVNEKNFLELFSYKENSLWWFFSQETFFLKLGEIISFISNFYNLISKKEIIEVRIISDFKWTYIIEQICKKFEIPVKFSRFEYSKFLLNNFSKNYFKFYLKQRKLKYLKKHRINFNKTQFSSSGKHIPNITDKVIFISPITYRRKLYNFNSKFSENREYLVDDLIKIGNIKNSCGISIDFSSDPNSIVNLKERIEDNLKWFPEEMILKSSTTKSMKIFFSKYDSLLKNSQFQNLFRFKGILFWKLIQEVFLSMKFEPYLPYWILLLDSVDNYFLKNKPRSIFLTAETNANTLAYIFAASKHNVKTIRIQQAMITEKNMEFIHNNYFSKNNSLGYPTPDYMLVYGSYAKEILIKNGYPSKKLIEFGNPTFAFLDYIEQIDKKSILNKYTISDKQKIILFTSTKWQNDLMGKDFDPMIWDELLKIYSNKDEYFIILKPHPGEKISTYENILSNYNCNNATIIQDSLVELLHISDIVISNYSSVIIDACCLNKPIIEIIWDDISENSTLNYHKIGITIPSKIENLKFNVKNILEKQSITSEYLKKQIIFLKEQYGIPIDRNEMIDKLKNLV